MIDYRRTRGFLPAAIAAFGIHTAVAWPAEKLQGLLQTDGLTGAETVYHGWVGEKIFVTAGGDGQGAGAETAHRPPGWFSISAGAGRADLGAGPYTLFTLCYDGAPAFGYGAKIQAPADQKQLDHLQLTTPAHYSVMYNVDWHEWGDDPWLSGDDFYQTFAVTEPYVTRVATKLADKSGDHFYMTLNFAIYETNNGPPSQWKRISPVRQRFLSEGTDPIIHVFWVPYRSDEVRLVPGRTYAVRLWRDPSSQSATFALVARPDKGDGYRKGHLYIGDQPRKDYDAYAYVSGGAKGTVVNHAPVGEFKLEKLVGSGRRFGQTFRASGNGLAGVDIIFTTGQPRPPEWPIRFQLYDKPGGQPVGPARTCRSLPLAFQGRAAAIWSRGEAPLTPGQMYYIEWSTEECNTWRTNEDLPGHAYLDGQPKTDMDLAMSIAEYVDRADQEAGIKHSETTTPETIPASR